MRTAFSLMFLIILFQSCNNKVNTTEKILILADSNLVSTIINLTRNTNVRYNLLQEETYDPAKTYRATIWLGKALEIQKQTDRFLSVIRSIQIKKDLNANQLKSEIINFKDSILKIDTLISNQFKFDINEFPKSYDSSDKQSDNLISAKLSTLSQTEYHLFFSQLKFQIRLLENNMVQFCEEQVPNNGDYFDTYSAIIAQNSFVFPYGKELKIIAGVGAFSRKAKPIFTISGKKVEIGDDGTVHYNIIVPRKEGKYHIPVKIQFYDIEHKQQTIEKTVEYQVKN